VKIAQKISALLGVGGERSAAAPQYAALADGLVITTDRAEAWFVLSDSNTDLMSEGARDAELDYAVSALTATLAGYDCHLRVVWSPVNAADYTTEAAGMFTAGRWQEWAELRVQRLEQIALPTRHLLLGVRLADRQPATLSRGIQQGIGISATGVPQREVARWDAEMRRLARRLEASPWRAQPAAVEMLAWMVSREQHRDAPLPAAAHGVVTGARLATLTRGRVLPYPDHLRVMGSRGEVAAWVSVVVLSGFPEQMDSPGSGEWLRILSEINYVPEPADDPDVPDPSALVVPVSPEASVRFRVSPKREALKRVEETRKSAKEQRHSAAKHSAEDPGLDIQETEEVMAALSLELHNRDLTLIEDHPRLVVTSTVSLDDLRSRVDAVLGYYGGIGIEAVVGEEEQRELWLETQLGDRTRVPDLGHVRDAAALAGSWFWGGARVGDDDGPIAGYLTGSTSAPFRNNVVAGSDRGDATTTAFLGRSGRGKTTSMMLSMLDAGFLGAYCLALDFKCDLGGVVTAARHYGLTAHLVEIGVQHAGVVDLFAILGPEGREQASIEVPAQLVIAAPPHLVRRGAETPIQKACNQVINSGEEPATWRVIDVLRASADEVARETGEALHDLAQTPTGAPFMGRPTGTAELLRPQPGIWVVQMPGLSLPPADADPSTWNVAQRLSVALMHSMLAYGVVTTGRRDLRTLPKAVCVPEVHVLTATQQGSAFLQYIARVGRALGTSLLLDSQDPQTLAQLVGVVEQLTAVVGFQLTSADQQDALAELLDLPRDAHTRALIQAIGMDSAGEIRHGHCIVRDRRFRSATVQWDIPSRELRAMLDTSPRAQQARIGDPAGDGDDDPSGVALAKAVRA
jgi:hypothetical protein